ncbi:nucleotidyltransferase domain-containing protein [Dehalococcoidia bacterium]|nr:nucleotidyltransferase domain-containing protein [Dehalococcoidia bacterium]MCL0069206.1 nucleotidyltransferase domain-containing protein [Dehalococcoidia bacterium]MCL0077289.1 nucleotidyltransferase domain-containing protein [Dehalococcoidia bacterium]MCL0079229.1 nucleotidyltransferase domain-containing protein [Dehalococcoidia bacterium]MCL0079519.1 nucleotidyltransferase domain-containing protein [Dehalococcoidia bacterium]
MDNTKEKSIEDIKAEIWECLDEMGVTVKNIILFGSRARGDFSKSSDYDFLIVTEKTFTIKEKMKIAKKIRVVLAEFYIPADIIIKSEEELENFRHRIGTVTREALKEGMEI